MIRCKMLLLLVCFGFNSFSSFAQNFEGVVTFSMTYLDESAASTNFPMTLEYLIKGEKMKIKTPLELIAGEMSVLLDYEKNQATMISGIQGYGIVVDMGTAVFEQQNSKEKVKVTKHTKKILGYTCKKALVYKKNGLVQEVWYTQKLTKLKGDGMGYIDGFPMEYSDEMNGSKVKFVATVIEKRKVKDDEFEAPEGYVRMSKEDAIESYGMD